MLEICSTPYRELSGVGSSPQEPRGLSWVSQGFPGRTSRERGEVSRGSVSLSRMARKGVKLFEDLPIMESPFDIMELTDGEEKTLNIQRFEVGHSVIKVRYAPIEKDIKILRVWVPREDKPAGMPYWDITSQTLIAQLLEYLKVDGWEKNQYWIKKFGVPPRARFQLVVTPRAAAT